MKSLVASNEAIMVLGGLNAKLQDRTLRRSAVRPVQLIINSEVEPVSFFDSWGVLGVSSLAWHPDHPLVLYVTTGLELLKIDLKSQNIVDLDIPNLRDVHEITIVGNTLWLANTGMDEAIAFDLKQEKVLKRVGLRVNNFAPTLTVHEEDVEVVDKFHCNQIFEDLDGELHALVHHVSGKQLIRRVANKLIKNQGNGGVISLVTGKSVPLGLKGPHSVKKVCEHYWICDSGRATINIYDRTWKLQRTLSTDGWGRGVDVSEHLRLLYAGVSETRKRYLSMTRNQRIPNMIKAFSIENRAPVGDVELSNIEQVNNVYTIPIEIAYILLKL